MPAFIDSSGPHLMVSSRETEAAMHGRHPSTVFNGARAIALVKLRGCSRMSQACGVCEIDSLGWVIGHGETVPRVIRVPAVPGCIAGILHGDSLLVPLPPGFRGNELQLAHCPEALGVNH